MPPSRCRRFPPSNPLPKAIVSPNIARHVDALLKSLRTVSKRLHAAGMAYHIDLTVLRKLNDNATEQHRSALFYRHIAHVKRSALRLQEYDMASIIDNFRSAFYDETVRM